MTSTRAWALSIVMAAGACMHARGQDGVLDRNLGRQPEGIEMLDAGSDLKQLMDMPRGEKGPWRYLLTIDSTRATDTGQVDETGANVGKFAYRRVSHVALVLETRPELVDGDKRTYYLTMEQAAVDAATAADGDKKAVRDLPKPDAMIAPPREGETMFARILPRTMGIRGTLVMDREGWIDSLTFDWGDDPDSDAVTLCLDLERVLRGLMPPMPDRDIGSDASWQWAETQAADGVLIPVTRLVDAVMLAALGDMPQTVTFKQTWTSSQQDFAAEPVSLAFANADVKSKQLMVTGSGQSTWEMHDDASPLPKEGSMAVDTSGASTWRPKDQPDAALIDARMSETTEWTIRELDEPLAVFPEQDEGLPEYQVDPLRLSTPVEFEQAVGFMERQLADLELALQPGAAAAREQAGEGEPVDVQLNFVLGVPLRAKVQVEQMDRQESALGTVDETTAFRVDGEITVTLDEVDEKVGYRGTLVIDKAGGVELEQLAVGPAEQTIAPQSALKAFVGKPMKFTMTTAGMIVVETDELERGTDLGVRYILTEVVDGFRQMQVGRPFDGMRMGQTNVRVTGGEKPEGVQVLTTLTLEGTEPRIVRETQLLRAATRESDLFTLTPLIKDARVKTSYYHELAVEDGSAWLPKRGKRGDVHRTTATYERGGVEGTGQKVMVRAVIFESIE